MGRVGIGEGDRGVGDIADMVGGTRTPSLVRRQVSLAVCSHPWVSGQITIKQQTCLPLDFCRPEAPNSGAARAPGASEGGWVLCLRPSSRWRPAVPCTLRLAAASCQSLPLSSQMVPSVSHLLLWTPAIGFRAPRGHTLLQHNLDSI